MKTIRTSNKFTGQERETVLNYDVESKEWYMYSAIPKHFRKALKQKWTPITQWVDDDGSVVAMELTAPERAITIRNTDKKQLSDKQLNNLPNE